MLVCKWFTCFEFYVLGVTDYLTTEISTSKQKRFSLVTFVDTPGLVDGDMKYPFDVNKSILWLGRSFKTKFVIMGRILFISTSKTV